MTDKANYSTYDYMVQSQLPFSFLSQANNVSRRNINLDRDEDAVETGDRQPDSNIGPTLAEEYKTKAAARALGMDKEHFDRLIFAKDLANVTCACGHGYFKPDKTWVSGAEVRNGLAPPKPSTWS
ncbi:hypothetical protein N0V90_006345 [Kalmusia sp. IMI 367209]|nr:hypothetical protein N0V90_006345 [Kalmusia sp. IMI 367209]